MNSIYSRPAGKPRTMAVTRRREKVDLAPIARPIQITVDKSTECHVTPPGVSAEMVSYLADSVDLEWAALLEPQGGTGNLVQELINSGAPVSHITAVERHYKLADCLSDRFSDLTVQQDCFLEFAKNNDRMRFDGILTNPPFKKVIAHMRAAHSLLTEGGGVMIALVPTSYKDIDHDLLEVLPSDTFSTCTVNTKIIMITK